MARKKSNVKDGSLCASGLTDKTERKIMARAMQAGEDQINIVRESKNQESNSEESSEE